MGERCFLALDLPGNVLDEVMRIQQELERKKLFFGKCTEKENIHLTLKFLGEIDEDTLKNVKEKLKKIKIKPFTATLSDVGVFSEQMVRIIWVQLDGVDELQKQIDLALESLFKPEERFMGHITIARVKHVDNKTALLDAVKKIKVNQLQFTVERFCLKKSVLTTEKPVYTILEEYPLR